MRLKLDLHVHSANSHDCSITLEEAVKHSIEKGLDGFAVTDHDKITDIPEHMAEESDLVIVQGVEISARGAHVLGLYVSDPIPPNLSIIETVDIIHDQGGFAIVAHPYSFFKTWINIREIEKGSLDAVEVANSSQFPFKWMLKKNRALAQTLELPQTGGSDAHIPRTIGRAYTMLNAETKNLEGVFEALRMGETEAEGVGISLAERLKRAVRARKIGRKGVT